jgi:hypothetical protein
MKRTLVSSALVLSRDITGSRCRRTANAERHLDSRRARRFRWATSEMPRRPGFHALGTLAISGTASTPVGFRIDGMYNSLSGKKLRAPTSICGA